MRKIVVLSLCFIVFASMALGQTELNQESKEKVIKVLKHVRYFLKDYEWATMFEILQADSDLDFILASDPKLRLTSAHSILRAYEFNQDDSIDGYYENLMLHIFLPPSIRKKMLRDIEEREKKWLQYEEYLIDRWNKQIDIVALKAFQMGAGVNRHYDYSRDIARTKNEIKEMREKMEFMEHLFGFVISDIERMKSDEWFKKMLNLPPKQ